MSANERVRLDAMHRVERGEVTVVSAAVLMSLSLRQARRLWKHYRIEGAAGLTHRSRGRASNRRLEEGIRERIVKRHQGEDVGVYDTVLHATEYTNMFVNVAKKP